MEDTRLFGSNNPIGRFWYFFHIFSLAALSAATKIIIQDFILPNAKASYEIPIKVIVFCIFFIFLITFFMLIDRRIYAICGERDSKGYKIMSNILSFIVFIFILSSIVLIIWKDLSDILYHVLLVCAVVFVSLIFLIGLVPSKITYK